jgi:TetR/AcrR family transcriptional regulator, regulator of cefoperazone and chloramphenicol sensitivity
MKEETKDNVRDKIIQTTLEIISKEGIDKITIRQIAKESGVNVASINYYFGSKEKLVTEVIKYLFETKVKAVFDILENQKYSSEEKLYNFFVTYLNELSKHPGLFQSIISHTLNGDLIIFERIPFIKNGIGKIVILISEITGVTDKILLTIRTMHLMSAILFPMAMSNFYPLLLEGITLTETETRNIYVKTLLKNNLNIDFEILNKEGGKL